MLPAAIVLDFDPTIAVGGMLVRWETIGLAAALLVGLVGAALLAGRANRSGEEPQLRRDDLIFIVLGALPGAVVVGRIVHGLDFFAFYATVGWGPLLDPTRGSLSLLGAVLGGCLTGAWVGWLLGVPLRRWLDVAIVPLLVTIALGKFANVLGGAGLGAPTDAPWALAYAGAGPWRAIGPDIPAHPSQVYEGLWALAGILVVGLFALPWVVREMPAKLRRPAGETAEVARVEAGGADDTGEARSLPPERLRPGFLFGLGLGWWALGRVVVGFSWRDEAVLLGMNAEQLAALVVLIGCLTLLVRTLWPRGEEAY